MSDRIFLVGPMGAGKSAVGRHLAQAIGLAFQDADTYLEERTGVDIAYIFEREGEPGFRKRECQAIETLTQHDNIVLATGGGAVMNSDNRRFLAARGTVVYLHASVEQQFQRVSHATTRPLLQEADPQQILTDLYRIRKPLYESIADLTVSTDGMRVPAVSNNIRDELRERRWIVA
ncbi:MAG: shikimate kinase AroK [Woeseiaceae bacterium]